MFSNEASVIGLLQDLSCITVDNTHLNNTHILSLYIHSYKAISSIT